MESIFEQEANAAFDEQRIIIKTKKCYYKLWRFCDIFLRIVTFNKQKRFLTHFTTVMGRTVYFPIGWDRSKAGKSAYVILRHERKHIKQAEDLGRGNFWLGKALFILLYFLVFFPIGLAWFRYKFEREAYVESFKACKRVGLKPNVNQYIEAMTGPKYVWTWPFKKSVKKWFYKYCI